MRQTEEIGALLSPSGPREIGAPTGLAGNQDIFDGDTSQNRSKILYTFLWELERNEVSVLKAFGYHLIWRTSRGRVTRRGRDAYLGA